MDTTAIQDIVGELRAKLRHEQDRMAQHAQRAEALKTAIRELESLGPELDQPSITGLSNDGTPSLATLPSDVQEMSTKDLVVWVLDRDPRKEGWTAGELAEAMQAFGWGQDVKSPDEAVRTALVRLEQDDQSPVRRVSRGHYSYENPLDLPPINPAEQVWHGGEVKAADADT